MDDNNTLVQKYIQYSKKITLFGMIQWCVLALIAMCISIFGSTKLAALDEYTMGVVKTVVVWSATVAFISVSSYEVNSAVEKAVKQKFESSLTAQIMQNDRCETKKVNINEENG